MSKKIEAPFFISIIVALVYLPFFFVDFIIIELMGGVYHNLLHLMVFLLVLYIIELVLGLLMDSLSKVISDFTSFEVPSEVVLFFDFFLSLGILTWLDSIFSTVDLSFATEAVIMLVHSLTLYLVNKTNATSQQDEASEEEKLAPHIEYEIELILREENYVNCINTIKMKYPEIPKTQIIKTVRRILHEQR
ncbi:YrvL family regulatory protein [Aureibacillus halotolerans]|uniref:Regulatory protein YrvL n=1 Tax=Aureibacillus halotolerans TaxID=1508390 RepID=A0A4R6TZG6_9BACI|nr:YrvL family regulatory protein [Aureibacillus halotolerans]TDQ37385.1 regulatory protein YrvL [Aureibacillus halotolerans]